MQRTIEKQFGEDCTEKEIVERNIYIGKSSRSLAERSSEHVSVSGLWKGDEGSFIIKYIWPLNIWIE